MLDPGSEGFEMLIAGRLSPAVGGEWLESINPTTEEVLARFPAGGTDDVDRAVAGALAAFPAWRDLSWQERAHLLREFARRIRAEKETFARLDALDSGNAITAMRRDVDKGAGALDFFAGLAGELKGESLNTGPDLLDVTLREPFGVVGRMIPYNHPIAAATGKLAAPLAAGNVVVLKPSERASLSALFMGRIAQEVFPPGVVSVLSGEGAEVGEALVAHPDVPRIAFIGSVPNGRRVYQTAAAHIKEVTLELGGKNPFIVFDDVDVEQAAQAAVRGMNFTATQGQSCGSTSRVFVHRAIYDDFVTQVVKRVEQLRVGDPLDDDTHMGPLSYEEHYHRVLQSIEQGKAEGANLLTGGSRPDGFDRGYFIRPTVFDRVEPGMSIAREEIFGPVMSILEWGEWDEMIAAANGVRLGLTANVWTRDITWANRTARALEAGYVWINGTGQRPAGAPFGGYKMSGIGRESSFGELVSYTREKNVCTVL